jgi:hypothetical protein
MSEYHVIKNIMESKKISENDKVYFIKMFLKGWNTEKEIEWIWEGE